MSDAERNANTAVNSHGSWEGDFCHALAVLQAILAELSFELQRQSRFLVAGEEYADSPAARPAVPRMWRHNFLRQLQRLKDWSAQFAHTSEPVASRPANRQESNKLDEVSMDALVHAESTADALQRTLTGSAETRPLICAIGFAAGRAPAVVVCPASSHCRMEERVLAFADHFQPDAYQRLAEIINDDACEVVSLHHQFGFYPGHAGSSLLDLLRGCAKPIVTTFHMLPKAPTGLEREEICAVVDYSEQMVVANSEQKEVLSNVYSCPASSIHVIPNAHLWLTTARPESRSATEICPSTPHLAVDRRAQRGVHVRRMSAPDPDLSRSARWQVVQFKYRHVLCIAIAVSFQRLVHSTE